MAFEILLERIAIGFGDTDDLVAYIDAVVAIDRTDIAKRDDERTVDAHES